MTTPTSSANHLHGLTEDEALDRRCRGLGNRQRIVNGLQDVLKLFIARIATVTMVILSSLVIGVFPMNLRHGSLLTLFIVGVPALAFAAWAQPGTSLQQSLARRMAHFVVPAAFLSSLLGFVVFYGPLLYWLGKLVQGPSDQIEAGVQNVVVIGQTSLTVFLGLVGLLLVVFAKPPTRW